MRKLMFICLVLISAKSFSQEATPGFGQRLFKRLEFWLKAGVNYSNFTDASFPTDPLIGFHAGGTVAFKFTKNFLIQQEFLFSTEGVKNKGDEFNKEDIRLYYISVPILLKYRTNIGLYVEAGTQVGMKAKEEVAGLNGREFAKKLDVAAVGGIGFQSKIGLGIGARYVYGLSKVGDFDISNTRNDFKNNNAQVSIFYVF
jgi:hypothetical protein